jgi:hypothetical protein
LSSNHDASRHPAATHAAAAAAAVMCCCLHAFTPCRWDYGIGGMVDAAKSLADLQAKGLIKQVGMQIATLLFL